MSFFFDNCVSERITRAIEIFEQGSEIKVEHLKDRFGEDAKDVDWIPIVAVERSIIITADHAQRKTRGKTEAEAVALQKSGAIAFYLPKTFVHSSRWEQAWKFFKWWPPIKAKAAKAKPGDIFDVRENGSIELKKFS